VRRTAAAGKCVSVFSNIRESVGPALGSGALCTRRRDRAASYFSDAGAPTFRDTS
jgi:hypothetical protein